MPKTITLKLLASLTSEKGKQMFAINIKDSEIRNFKTERDARNAGNGFILFNDAEELAENSNIKVGSILVDAYNNHSDRKISRFSDRKTGAVRVTKIAASMPPEGSSTGEKEAPKEKEAPRIDPIDKMLAVLNAENLEASPRNKKAPRQFKGKMVSASCEKNPRREGTHAYASMELLINKGPMLYDEFIKAGGRRPDFAYDVNHGWAKVQD